MSQSIEDLTNEVLGRIQKELPKIKVSSSVEEALEKACEETTPERGGDPRRLLKDKEESGWTLP